MNEALIYLRVSTPEQLKQFSIPSQLKFCRDYATAHDLHSVAEFVDDKTAKTVVRSHFTEVLRRLRAGEVKHLIINEIDRFTREPADFIPLRRELHALGVTIHVALENRIISPDPLAQLPDDIKAIIAKHEHAVFRDRSMRGRAAKVASGRVPGNGLAPYGFCYEGRKRDRHLVINEAEAAVVQRIARWYAIGDGNGPMTIPAIVERLKAEGVPTRADASGHRTKRAGYASWNYGTVWNLLRDDALGGIFYANRYRKINQKARLRPREEWTPIPIPRILDPDLFDAVQRRLDRGRALAKRNNTKNFYLLRCRVRCSCGAAWCGWARGGSDRRYYRCNTRDRSRYEACGIPMVRADQVEQKAWAWLVDEALAEHNISAHLERRRTAAHTPDPQVERRAQLLKQLQTNATAQQRLLDLYLRDSGEFSQEALRERQASLRREEEALRRELAALDTPAAVDHISDAAAHDMRLYAQIIREGLTDMTPTEQRQALDMLDARFVLGLENGDIVATASCMLRLDSARLLIDSSLRSSSRDNLVLTLDGRFMVAGGVR